MDNLKKLFISLLYITSVFCIVFGCLLCGLMLYIVFDNLIKF